MKRTWKCLAALLLVCVILAALPGTIGAAQAAPQETAPGPSWETDRDTGTLAVTPGSDEELEDLASVNVVVDIYKVASAEIDGAKIEFTLESRYESLRESLDLLLEETKDDPNPTDSEGLRLLSQRAAWLAFPGEDPEEWDTPMMDGIPVPTTRPIPELAPGLYLVVTRSDNPADYRDTIIDEDGVEQVVTRVETEDWIYTYSPQLVFVPGTEYDEENNPLGWKFDVEMFLKHTRESAREGSVEIIKTLTEFVEGHPGLFVFQVDVYLDGELIQSGIYEMNFTEAGTQSLLIEGLPEGAEVVVTEVYSGASYRLVSDESVTGTIVADEVFQAEFVNEGSNGEGGAITNHFSYDEENGWVWTPIPEVE